MPTQLGPQQGDIQPLDADAKKLYSIAKEVEAATAPGEERINKAEAVITDIVTRIRTFLEADFAGSYGEFRDVIAKFIRQSIQHVVHNVENVDDILKGKADDKYAARAIQTYLRDEGVIQDEKTPGGPQVVAAVGAEAEAARGPALQRVARKARKAVEVAIEPTPAAKNEFNIDSHYAPGDEFKAALFNANEEQRVTLNVFNNIPDEATHGIDLVSSISDKMGLARNTIIIHLNKLLNAGALEETNPNFDDEEVDLPDYDIGDDDDEQAQDDLNKELGGNDRSDRGTSKFMDPWN